MAIEVTHALSEDVFQKPARGRPRMMTPEHEAMCRRLMEKSPETTLRSVQNWVYAGQGLSVLGGDVAGFPKESTDRWGWLLRVSSGVSYCRKSIVSQLGRTRQPEAIPIFADELCRLRPTARQAIRLLRRWQERLASMIAMRLARGEEPNVSELALKLTESQHPLGREK